jgi:hypothetical protein
VNNEAVYASQSFDCDNHGYEIQSRASVTESWTEWRLNTVHTMHNQCRMSTGVGGPEPSGKLSVMLPPCAKQYVKVAVVLRSR